VYGCWPATGRMAPASAISVDPPPGLGPGASGTVHFTPGSVS
jgi:hypothetical protein